MPMSEIDYGRAPLAVRFESGDEWFSYDETAVKIPWATLDYDVLGDEPEYFAEIFEIVTGQTLWRSRTFEEERHAENAANKHLKFFVNEFGFGSERLNAERVFYFKWVTSDTNLKFEDWVKEEQKKENNVKQARQTSGN